MATLLVFGTTSMLNPKEPAENQIISCDCGDVWWARYLLPDVPFLEWVEAGVIDWMGMQGQKL